MEKKEALKMVDELEVSEDKKRWIEQYAMNHIEAENNPIEEKPSKPAEEFQHFEVHPTMKELWKTRNLNIH